jgi:hypothetical protein
MVWEENEMKKNSLDLKFYFIYPTLHDFVMCIMQIRTQGRVDKN